MPVAEASLDDVRGSPPSNGGAETATTTTTTTTSLSSEEGIGASEKKHDNSSGHRRRMVVERVVEIGGGGGDGQGVIAKRTGKDVKKRKRLAMHPSSSAAGAAAAADEDGERERPGGSTTYVVPRTRSTLKRRRRPNSPDDTVDTGDLLGVEAAPKLDKEDGRVSSGGVAKSSEQSMAPKAAQESTPEENNGAEKESRRRRKQGRKSGKGGDDGANVDEKMRITRSVKRLVNRIRLEENLLDAYIGEGWKGHNREKLRPEMELRRAQQQILRCKLEIRDLIRDLDNLAQDGSLDESAFDEEGRIFHEEIFCAKCKSQETSVDNDIILCDGACDCGYHQKCLEPPLATADIPPDDEGWLCPVCDYKVECLNFINGYLGTEFQVEDRWEKIFAEAAGSVGGGVQNALTDDWPSEDSDDDEYDPEKKVVQDEKEDEDGGDAAGHKADWLLSGSESEPEASLGSDVAGDDDESGSSDVSGDELGPQGGASEEGGGRVHDPDIPAASATTLATSPHDVVPVLGKRQRKPVDYSKLQVEMFGKDDVDVASEDEEWGPRSARRRKPAGLHGVGRAESDRNGAEVGKEGKYLQRKSLVQQPPSVDGNEPYHIQKKPFTGDQSDDRKSRRLPDIAVKTLRKEFESGTRFPTRAWKQSLTKTLGISFQQVSSWFKQARRVARQGGTDNGSPSRATKVRNEINSAASDGILTGREAAVEEIEVTNGILIEKLDEVQHKLHYLKQILEVIVAQPDAESESRIDRRFDNGFVTSHANGKHVLYVPVAEVVDKDAGKAPLGNQ